VTAVTTITETVTGMDLGAVDTESFVDYCTKCYGNAEHVEGGLVAVKTG
jgi:hypothetical protein